MKTDSTVVTGSTFLVTDEDGQPSRDHDGFYHRDVRHLDCYDLSLPTDLDALEVVDVRPGERLLHLGSPLETGARRYHVARHQFVTDGLYERITVSNLTDDRTETTLTLSLGTRFDDLFEVRGMGTEMERTVQARTGDAGVTFSYDPDDVDFDREVSVTVDGTTDADPAVTTDGQRADATLTLPLTLAAGEHRDLSVAVTPTRPVSSAVDAVDKARRDVREREHRWLEATTLPDHDESWQDVLAESRENLLELRLDTEHGPLFSAGVPWFATAFGRDSLIAAYQALPLTTEVAKGTCRYLAAQQATEVDPERDAEPGKILHEIRHGELTARELVPHRPYFGTVDATALFVVLAHETWRFTGDDEFAADLWPHVDRGLTWLEEYGIGDGEFVTYDLESGESGSLRHQAWKDSGDGILFPDGRHPSGDLAAAEVQGYAYDAMRRGAELADHVGAPNRARELERAADGLRTRFDDAFWLSEESFYAVAVTGAGEQIPSVTTNPGHCLWSGIVPETRADSVVDRLLAPDMFTGWGIRTLSADHDAYNPQSYHLGSVWPHDNSLCALGMARYDREDAARRVGEGLVAAARARGNDRLPELFAGFDRDRTTVPVTYGEACEPQAWAAAAPLACLRAVDGDPVAPPLLVE
ncbi:hypothetical protein EGH21_19165 [Halomicroarcula sp. F13]|uniref:Amylo-alpha-1,6-glucosidase n=1 Tax=Haloarcula rubra TaxID=2487747 RepID=A0AAW4PV08_9EURY|nr:glycogen debranching N-terminal domain-containing protein [Halomicroarcula rubra]MBX0325151.1 hypothetical protein [Halomicroarcula rubra]